MGRLDRGGGHGAGVRLQGAGGTPEGESWFPPQLGCLPTVWPRGGAWPPCARQHLLQSLSPVTTARGLPSAEAQASGSGAAGPMALSTAWSWERSQEGVPSGPRKSRPPSARVLPLSSGPLSLQVLLLVVSSVSCGSSPEAREASPCFSHPDGPSSRVPCVHI